MSSVILSVTESGDIYFLLIAIGIIVFMLFGALMLAIFGFLPKTLNGIDKNMSEKSVYDSIPQIREIAKLYPDEKIGKVSNEFLEKWDKEIKPALKQMDHSKRMTKLRSVYKGIIPILEAIEQITES